MAISSAFRSELTAELTELAETLRALEDENLTDWEYDFVWNMQTRLETYRGEAIVTPRQWEQIDRLTEKYKL